jgi:hypothetical protein
MGLTEARIQLLLPMCEPKKSEIDGGPRRPYYTKVEGWTQKYATLLGLGESYGHEFRQVLVPELVHFDAALVRDGVHGGSNGALYRRWQRSSTIFDPRIANSITHTQWLQIKRTLKLCDKQGEHRYDPAYKYDYICCTIIDNLNSLTEQADLNLCGDETTYGHVSFQSTSSTNISTVNAPNSNKLFVVKKEHGQGAAIQKWAIKMNKARQLYLKTHGRIDTIDSLIRSCHVYC